MTVDNVPAVQIKKERYQFARIDEENITAPPISHGYQTQASILQSKETDSESTPGVRQIDTLNFEPTGEQLVFGISSPTPKEHPCKISAQSNMGIDHHDHANSPGTHQLAGVGVPEFQTIQNQCQTIHNVEEIVSMSKNQILHGPNVSNIKNSASEHCSDGSVRRNANLIESDAANSQMVPAQLESISGSPTATSNIPTLPNHHPTATTTLQQNSGIQGINKSAAIPVGNQGHVAHPKAILADAPSQMTTMVRHGNNNLTYHLQDQDVNGDGQWLEIQYENLASYCTNCRHLGHSMQSCPVKLRDLEIQRKKQEEIAVATTSQTITQQKYADKAESSKQKMNTKQQGNPKRGGQDQKDRPKVAEQKNRAAHQNEVIEIPAEEWQTQKKKNFKGNNQNKRKRQVYKQKQPGTQQQQDTPAEQQASQQSGRGSKWVSVPHVLHECAFAQMADHRLDSIPPATTALGNASDQVSPTDEEFEVLSSENDHLNQQNIELRKLAKGKAHAVSDYSINPPLPPPQSNNKPSKKKRQAMRRKNSGISINEPSENASFQSPAANLPRPPDPNSTDKTRVYKDPGTDPSLSQPLLETKSQSRHREIVPYDLQNHLPTNVLSATPLEECDEYRPIQLEDEMSGGIDDDEHEFNATSNDYQHYDLLVNAVNGPYDQSDAIDSQGLSPRKFNPSPRLTRSKAAGNTSVPPNLKKPSQF
ncbi:hypothetical protein A4A49_27967 [Nicotiana attenuata]|uniref:Zinc knuckle CX2CX4HX4C domain-containing protein n=1 Tax=Nicotiana attenuata TaxID=49451 RepID=A0A1J6KQA2_NICAT|nr:hypothetical protein A4A49_27967 [Nicotiana attenuata]